MEPMTPTDIYSQLTRDEGGCVLHVYPDSKGIKTVYVGHNLEANPLPDLNFTLAQGLQVLQDDVTRITAQLLKAIPWMVAFQQKEPVRFGVFQNMAFNMGAGGVMAFHHALADTQAGNYLQASLDMMNSLWYHQVGARAERLCQQMRTGVWV
jgi:lysozyme